MLAGGKPEGQERRNGVPWRVAAGKTPTRAWPSPWRLGKPFGYASALYDEALAGWTRHTFEVPNHASGRRKRTMTEVLWCNF
jgi:hypothetical protein